MRALLVAIALVLSAALVVPFRVHHHRAFVLAEEGPPQRALGGGRAGSEGGQVSIGMALGRFEDHHLGAQGGPLPGGVGGTQPGAFHDA